MHAYNVSGDEVKNSKPAPDIFLKVATELGVNPDNCLVIEDSSNGVKAGAAKGMKVIGYHNLNFPLQDLSRADKVLTSFKGLDIDDLIAFFN
ncbi:HAD family hydrolase [Amphibacillus sp. Q70]|uniref:HAD family hydrolase n=1 Tax=Amphibacillus sp. Q70 TaxID=3453416 RepID=UPI003F85A75D